MSEIQLTSEELEAAYWMKEGTQNCEEKKVVGISISGQHRVTGTGFTFYLKQLENKQQNIWNNGF